jgi:hypothetical protein
MNLANHLTEFLRDDERAKSEVDLLAELAKTAGRFTA